MNNLQYVVNAKNLGGYIIMGINNSKEHYKMYKDGKRWVFASISIMTVMLTGAVHADSVHADTTKDASSEVSNDDNATNELSQPQVVLDNKPVTKEDNLPASEDKQITTENISTSNKVEQDEQINDDSSNISSASSNNEVTTVKTESNLNDADSQTSAATSSAASVNSSAASANSEVTATSSAASVNSSAASANSEVTATSSATSVNSSSAASADSEVTATSNATNVNSSSAASADSEVTATSDATGVNSEAVTANSSAVVSGSSSAAITDAEIKKANTVPRTKAASQVISSVHVSSWNDFTSALKNKDINEIIIDNNIVASGSGSQSVAVRDNNTLLIRSNDGGRYAIDFRGAYPKGQLNLTYENIDLYGTVYYGVINTDVFLSFKQSNITFRNTSYTGAQLVYASDNTTVTFQGKNTIKAVSSYVSPVDGSIVSVSNSQQVLEFTGKNDYIIFDEGSIFEGSTFKDNVIRMTGNNSGITVKKGAIVTLIPHDNGTGKNGSAEWGNKANGIYMSGSGVLTVENGGTLNINAGEDSSQGVAAISITDKNTIMNINDGGTVNINVTGNISSYGGSGQSSNTAVYINGQLNTGYGASFNVNGHDMGSFSGTLVQISGNAKLLGSTFKIVLDDATSGTGSIILLDTGGNVSIESPKDFLLHLGTNSQAQWIKDGSFSLSKARLKTNGTTTGPFKTISFTVSGGNVLVTDADSKKIIGLTQADENKLISLLNQIGSDASVASLEFVQANGEVNIVDDNVTVTKENGKYLEVSGYTDTPGAYIHATINGNEFAGQKLDSPYWRENGIDTTVVYAAQASMTKDPNGKGYKFTFEIPNDVINTLTPGTNINLYATYNFLDSDVVSADLGILTAQQYRDKVNAAATDATSHINGLTHLTNQQKESLIGQVNTSVASVIDKFVDNVSQNSANSDAYDSFINDLNTITGLADGQDYAMDLLQTATENVINDINNIDGLTSTQISDYESQINKVHDDAILEIGQTLSPEDALTAEQNGEISFTNIKNTAQVQAAKNDAVAAIDTAATNAIAAIENNTSLTAGQKDAYKEQITNAATDAKNDINQATNVADVTTAEDAGTANISAVSDAAKLQAAKNDAANAIDTAATNAIAAIENNTSLTAGQKDAYKEQITNAATDAKNDINQATNVADVTTAEDAGAANISAVSDAAKLQAAKNDGIAKLDEAKNTTIAQITQSGLSADRQNALINAVNEAYDTAVDKVTADTTIVQVNQDTTDGVNAINGIAGTVTEESEALQAAQETAQNTINAAAEAAKNDINNNASLTADEKHDLVAAVDEAANTAKDQIAQATTPDEATEATQTGEANIAVVSDAAKLQAAKNEGIAKLDEAKNTTIAQITQSGLSADRQNALINAVNEAHDTAVDKVTADTTIVQVNQDTTDGVNAINGIAGTVTEESEALQAAQETAQNTINAAAEAAKNDINNNASLTADEKHDLVAAVDEAANTAKDQIAQATSPDEATEATQTGEANIAVVSDAAKLQAAKNDAVAAIDTAATNAIAAIENNTSLTAGQKDAYKEQITNAATDAKNDINQATNVADVTTAEDAGAANISAVSDAAKLQAAKNDAVNAIDTAATNAIAAIENNTSLTAGQKDAYKEQIINAATDAKNDINQATNVADVTTAEDAGAANISAVSDAAKLQAAKNDGIAKLDEAKNTTIAQITQSGLSADRQNALINAVNEAYDTAVDKVTADTTIVQVNQDTTDGVNVINGIAGTVTEESEALQTAQNVAKDKINQIAQAAIKEINQNSNLTSKEKQRFIDGILQVVTDFNSHITNTTSSQEVALAEKDSEIAINNISGAAKLQAAKNVSINKLDKAKATVIDKVYHSGLSINRQNELINKIKHVYNDAVGKVKNDKTINSVEHDTIVGLNAINSILSEISKEMASLHDAQVVAISHINEIANNIMNTINHNNALTDKQKYEFINQIMETVNITVSHIKDATSLNEVTNVEQAGISSLNKIKDLANLQVAKNNAIAKLNDAKTSVINKIKDSILNINQQTALINMVNTIYSDALNDINNDVTIEQVMKDMNNGINKINAVLNLLNFEVSQISDVQHTINHENSTNNINENSNNTLHELIPNNSTNDQINNNVDDRSKDSDSLNLPNTNVDVNEQERFNNILAELLLLITMISLGGTLIRNKKKSE
jgi:hypothetical protein